MKKIQPPFVRNPYNYDTNEASNESAITCKDPTLAQQQYAEDADINTIVRRFLKTGEMPTNIRLPTYGDFTGIGDYHTALNAIAKAGETFDQLPARIRSRFDNDPGKFVDFCSDPENREEARKLGLLAPGVVDLVATTAPSVASPSEAPEATTKTGSPKGDSAPTEGEKTTPKK